MTEVTTWKDFDGRTTTIHMGLNTQPYWVNVDEAVQRWLSYGREDEAARCKRDAEDALALRAKIEEVLNSEGVCKLSWGCTGRTLHACLAHQWAEAMPEYEFEIGYDMYDCIVKRR